MATNKMAPVAAAPKAPTMQVVKSAAPIKAAAPLKAAAPMKPLKAPALPKATRSPKFQDPSRDMYAQTLPKSGGTKLQTSQGVGGKNNQLS